MAITIKNEEEIELMRRAGQMLARVHYELARELKEGMTTKEVDRLVEEMILSFGGYPNFKNYNGFPAAACVSLNEEVVHGIPSDKRYLKSGDIVTIDTGVLYRGYHSDAARTHAIGDVSPEAEKLIRVTEDSFFEAIKKAKPGNHIVDIGQVVQRIALKNGFSVVRDLTGHGIGTSLHEAPNVPNYRTLFKGPRLKKGMTLAVEPMINMGNYSVERLDDNWTFVTTDRSLSSHYENTIAITDDGCEILTMLPEEIEMRLPAGQGREKGKAGKGNERKILEAEEIRKVKDGEEAREARTGGEAKEKEVIILKARKENGEVSKGESLKEQVQAKDDPGRESKEKESRTKDKVKKAEAQRKEDEKAKAQNKKELEKAKAQNKKELEKAKAQNKKELEKAETRSKEEDKKAEIQRKEVGKTKGQNKEESADQKGTPGKEEVALEEKNKKLQKKPVWKSDRAVDKNTDNNTDGNTPKRNTNQAIQDIPKGSPLPAMVSSERQPKAPYQTLSPEEKRARREQLFDDE